MSQRIISSLFFFVFFISLLGTSKGAAQDLPGWYLTPPADNENEFYAIGEGETLRDATVSAFYQLATKIDAKVDAIADSFSDEEEGDAAYDSVFTNTTREVVNYEFDGVELSGMAKLSSEEYMDGNKTIWQEDFSQVIRMTWLQGESYYQASLFMEEIVDGPENYFFHLESEETVSGLDFGDFLGYVDERPGMEITHETRWRDTGYHYFVLLTYAAGDARKELENALKSDEELYREFKESDAFKQLQEDLKKLEADSTGN